MAYIPPSWEAYERLQRKLSSTNCAAQAAALEEALNVILQPDFVPGAVDEPEFLRVAASAARQDRHRAALLRRVHAVAAGQRLPNTSDDKQESGSGASSLDDEVHARKELARLAAMLREPDWELLTSVAAGVSYGELAREHASSAAALRSRVCRLRDALADRSAVK
ncbi:hypothetical protein [Burkholderia glumae]|uniref:hypothetical protein n=1 Tax=Burkholderia glumae TaxID=337 RepID=UPI001373ADA6|nr:hypothetical protein [Burkholderia glumae]MCR1770717.1 hypothetical protein [Burkholderia glumae]QHP92372.1 hypothetical protein EXE55_16330 [Burkholderia glumae]